MSEIDIFVSSTSIITLDHMKKLKNTFVGRTGHFDDEIDVSESLEGFSSSPLVMGCFVPASGRQG